MNHEAILATLQRTDRGRQALAALAPLAALWHTLDSNHRARMREVIYGLETHTGTISDACNDAAQAAQEAAELLAEAIADARETLQHLTAAI